MKYHLLILFVLFSSCSSKPQNSPPPVPEHEDFIHVAAVNFKVTGNSTIEQHFERLAMFAEQAKKNGATYLLLPELMVFDLLPAHLASAKVLHHLEQLARSANIYEKKLISLSKKNQLNLIGASVVIKKEKKFYNRAFYITDNGLVSYQDKIYPTPWEVKHHFQGGEDLKVFHSKKFSFAILICHDAEFPDLSAQLIKKRPEVLFVPSQTDDQAGLNRVKFTSAARAIEHMSYVLMTGTSGDLKAPWHSYVGQNYFFTPQNRYFDHDHRQESFNKETLSLFMLDLKKLRTSREDFQQVYPARDAKP
jgi:predicted amidohydrolase